MGYGGHILWTAVFREINEKTGKKILLCFTPEITDLLSGRHYNIAKTLSEAEIFKNNFRLTFNAVRPKSWIELKLDWLFRWLMEPIVLWRIYEKAVFRRSIKTNEPVVYAHLDMMLHSYVEEEYPDKFVWKSKGHIVDIICRNFALKPRLHRGELFFAANEKEKVSEILERNRLKDFVVIEPTTNAGYFGPLRGWDFEKWQDVVYLINNHYPTLTVVQVGIKGSRLLDGTLSLCGELTFRETAIVLGKSRFFMGTESGLMHAAYAVHAKALIVYSGVADPAFSGYADEHIIVKGSVSCSPCGRRHSCPFDHICIKKIRVDNVWDSLKPLLNSCNNSR